MTGTLSDVWRETVRRAPTAPAVMHAGSGEVWTRGQLATLAAAWRDTVPEPAKVRRRRIAFAEPNGVGWWATFLGLLDLGAVPVPLDVGEPMPRQLDLARAAGAARLWSGGEWAALGPCRAAHPDHCLVKLTSGSTGVPKAWAFTHAQMLADGHQVCATMGVREDDVVLAAIPLGHSYGLGNLVLPLLAQGTALALADPPLPNVLATAIKRCGCTVFPAVPALLDALSRSSVEATELRSLRLVVSAGARIETRVAAAFLERFERRVHNFYGTSETGGICFDRTGDATLEGRSVGTPLVGVTVQLKRSKRLIVSSAAVHGRGSFSPADFGLLNEHGELVLCGRAGRLVKVGARRLDLGEIEAALRALPQVRDAYAAISDSGRAVLGVVVATELSKADVRNGLREKLASWKQPQRVVVVPRLPTTPRGKPHRDALERLLFASTEPEPNAPS